MKEQQRTFIFLIFLFFFSFQLPAAVKVCHKLFEKNQFHQYTLWDTSFVLAKESPLFQRVQDVKPRTRVTRQQRKQAEADFLLAFKERNVIRMILLVKEFPFLKDIRFNDPSFLEQISEKHRHWCPRGWSPAQIASYTKDIKLLDLLLTLKMNIRSIKRPGGETVESNPLHISLRRDFKEGVIRILESTEKEPYGYRNRFIDEKDHQKQTPWHLAIERDVINGIKRDVENQVANQKIYYMDIVGKYEPSGLASSYWTSPKVLDIF